MKTAHFFSSKKEKVLIISETLRPVGETIRVSGKKEARAIAKAKAAKCWNF